MSYNQPGPYGQQPQQPGPYGQQPNPYGQQPAGRGLRSRGSAAECSWKGLRGRRRQAAAHRRDPRTGSGTATGRFRFRFRAFSRKGPRKRGCRTPVRSIGLKRISRV
ncbi:hypothetical protein EF912_11260 [Streptomyces sp. WAC07061]|nr:hypothetical protein EF912_11260 [Streptomyces sp. WAC07061]